MLTAILALKSISIVILDFLKGLTNVLILQ